MTANRWRSLGAAAARAVPEGLATTHQPVPSQDGRVALAFHSIASRLRTLLDQSDLADVDAVVAIARGGVVGGALAAYHLQLPMHVVQIRYRDDANVPLEAAPTVLGGGPDVRASHVLVVDDVCVSGATLRAACEALGPVASTTLVLKGRPGAADLVVFDDVTSCVRWPWGLEPD